MALVFLFVSILTSFLFGTAMHQSRNQLMLFWLQCWKSSQLSCSQKRTTTSIRNIPIMQDSRHLSQRQRRRLQLMNQQLNTREVRGASQRAVKICILLVFAYLLGVSVNDDREFIFISVATVLNMPSKPQMLQVSPARLHTPSNSARDRLPPNPSSS